MPASSGELHVDKWGTISKATFGFEIDGMQIGRFTSVTGLTISLEVVPKGSPSSREPVREYVTKITSPDLVLKRPVDGSDALQKWVEAYAEAAIQGRLERKNGVVVLYSAAGDRLREWAFEGAFPKSWTIDGFDATKSNEMVFESVTISHDGFV